MSLSGIAKSEVVYLSVGLKIRPDPMHLKQIEIHFIN